MNAHSHARAQSLPPQSDDALRVAFDKPRASSLDAGCPVHEANHRTSSPVRGILKKSSPVRGILKTPSTQSGASRRTLASSRKEREPVGRPRSQTSAKQPSPEAITRPHGHSRADSELDYVALARGQIPPFYNDDEQPQHARPSTDHTPQRRCVHWPDNSDHDGRQTRHHRNRARSSSMSNTYPSVYEQGVLDWESCGQGDVPRLPFQIADWRDVISDLVHLLRRRGDGIAEQVDLREFGRRKKRDQEARARYLDHKVHAREKQPPTAETQSMSHGTSQTHIVLNPSRNLRHVRH